LPPLDWRRRLKTFDSMIFATPQERDWLTLGDAFTIAEILGHQDLPMTKRYTHATDERKRMAAEKLATYVPANNYQKMVKKEKREVA
jgi:integrase